MKSNPTKYTPISPSVLCEGCAAAIQKLLQPDQRFVIETRKVTYWKRKRNRQIRAEKIDQLAALLKAGTKMTSYDVAEAHGISHSVARAHLSAARKKAGVPAQRGRLRKTYGNL